MSLAPDACCQSCGSVIPPVNVPGTPGIDGTPGTPGTAGINAFSFVTADFVIPAIGANVAATVDNNSWMSVGQNVFTEGPANWQVVSLAGTTSVTLKFLGYDGDLAPGNSILAGAKVSPSGIQGPVPSPLPIADGGTSATTKAGAQLALGLGQNITEFHSDVLAYDITNGFALITGVTVTVPALKPGLYEVFARATVQYNGVTFAASRLLSFRVRNTTAVTNVNETTRDTGIQTTATFPDFDVVLPKRTATLAAGDVLELQCMLDTVESAGSSQIVSASLAIIPLALT